MIDVGSEYLPKPLRLHVPNTGDQADYFALSHCLGDLSDEQKMVFCTSLDNIEQRQKEGFDLSILPQTFQDVVTVTRTLGKQYLWIDSLCIIQYGDDFADWRKEAQRMEAVFRNAYCTIAATSSKDSNQGFLKPPSESQNDHQCIKVNISSHGPIYISTLPDDF